MQIEDLLLELRSIQVPPKPGWWPLAPGWWLLILLVLLLILAILIYLDKQRVSRVYKQANQELLTISKKYTQNQDSQLLMKSLSRWLKQVSMSAYPERQIAGITGLAWTKFLDEVMGKSDFSQGDGKVFAGEVYSLKSNIDANRIIALCEQWLNSIKPRLVNRARIR